jgi:hypothetical protein
MWNELPMLWASLATNIASLAINIALLQLPDPQPGFLILGPLIASAAFNYWFWPGYGARTLKTGWFRFLGRASA